MQQLNVFIPLTKVDAKERIVYGVAAIEEPDKAKEIFDYETSKPNFEKWSGDIAKATDGKSLGNVRSMHGKVAAGRLDALNFNDANKMIEIAAKIVDDDEWKKVEEGVYTGFSVGGRYAKRWKDGDLTRYTAEPSEISLVDNPCMPSATFSMVKMDGTEEQVPFKAPAVEGTPNAPSAELEQVWKAKDGKTFAKKAEAIAHNEELAKAELEANDPAAKLEAALAKAKAAVEAPAVVPAAETSTQPADASASGGSPAVHKPLLKSELAKAKAALALEVTDAGKELVFVELRKSLYDVGRLASIVQELEWLQQSIEFEEEIEGDTASTTPKALKASIVGLCSVLRQRVIEETSELLDDKEAVEFAPMLEMAVRTTGVDALVKLFSDDTLQKDATVKAKSSWLEKVGARKSKSDQDLLNTAHNALNKLGMSCDMGKLAKEGARHSKGDRELLQQAHDNLSKVGAECVTDELDADGKPAIKLEEGGELQKRLEKSESEVSRLTKVIETALPQLDDLVKQVEKLKNEPVPGGPAVTNVRVVDKADDDAMAAKSVLEDLAKNNPAALSDAFIRLSQQNPRPFVQPGTAR